MPTGTLTQLRPAEELRRPDQHGQLPHILITLYPDRPLHELQNDDIIEINWNGVVTAIRDAVIRVKHEGDLSSSTVRETIQLIALVFKRLEMEDAQYRRLLANQPRIGIVVRLIALFPGAAGERVRKVIGNKRLAERKVCELKEIRNTIFEGRIELANDIDDRLDGLLLRESEEYRELDRQLTQQNVAILATAKRVFKKLKELDEVERIIADDDEAYGSAYEERKKQLIKFVVEAKTVSIERAMQAMRDARKQELYGQAIAATTVATGG